ncbi:MAG TPA: FtsQ-type POTRA domain-containing protein [Dongiaceae bacterium]|nr:FtsQ-type POTRA domain-containing protein [Dongiaceae bacterium]
MRKLRNRRLGRERVLGVKVRASHIGAARRRLAAVVLLLLFIVVLGAGLVWYGGPWLLKRLLTENPAFAIREFELTTDGVIAVDRLRRWTGVAPGANLLALDLAQVKRNLELVPLIESASVERIPPHTLRIRVFERDPIAQLNVPRPGGLEGVELVPYRIDAGGYIMLPLDPRERSATAPAAEPPLPLLRHLNPAEIQPGRRVQTPQLAAALQLLVSFEQSPMASLAEIKCIDLSCPDVLTVTTGQGAEVTFGLADLDQQLRRWQVICGRAQRENKAIATLDLAVTNNVPVRWLGTNAAASLTPTLLKPVRTRRKNV